MTCIPPNPSEEVAPEPAPSEAKSSLEALTPEHFYMEGPYLVFTAAYHLARGYCCNSNCRHCPYK